MSGRFLVTGAYGHLGNTMVRRLCARGETVRALVLPGDKDGPLEKTGAEIFRGDVCHPASLHDFFADSEGDTVLHAAGIVSIASKFDPRVQAVNVEGVRNIAQLCKEHGVRRLVHVSSVHALPEHPCGEAVTECSHFDPRLVKGLYAKTKAQATQIVLDAVRNGLDAVVVHPSGICGPGDFGHGHLTQLVLDYMNGGLRACVKGGYDFVDVRDVADGVIAASECGRTGECYLLTNQYFTVSEILSMLQRLSKRKPVKTVLPLWLAKATAPLAERYYKLRRQPPLYTAYSLYTLSTNAQFNHEKASRELGYCTRPMEITLRDTIQWLTAQGRIRDRKAYRAAACHK